MTDTAPPLSAYEDAAPTDERPANGRRSVRTPVHDPDLENLVACVAVEYPDRLPLLLQHGLAPQHLHQPGPRLVVAAAIDTHRAGQPVDRFTIRAQLPEEHADRWLAQILGREVPSRDPARIEAWVTELRRLHTTRHTDDILDRALTARSKGEPLEHVQAVLAELEHLPAAPTAGTADLTIETAADIARRVDQANPPRFLARPVLPEGEYGVIAAEDKAGKTWADLDLGVAVAAGTSWLDQYPCEHPGPVLMFLGEGSERKMIRRLRAVCEFHQVHLEDLDLRLCLRAPNLTRADHLALIRAELDRHPPRLVILDPLYLAMGNANTAVLAEMGQVLGALQYEIQRVGAGLMVSHHWNKGGTGNDRKRFTGSGTAEWGRVLASISVDERGTTTGHDSLVTQTWRFIGDEIPDTTTQLTRRVWTDDPDDLTSPMHYAVVRPVSAHAIAHDDTSRDTDIAAQVLDVLADGTERNQTAIVTACRGHRAQDVRRVLLRLADGGPLTLRLAGKAQLYRLTPGTDT